MIDTDINKINKSIEIEKDLSYFMKEEKDEIVEFPGIEKFKDKNGKVINFKAKALTIDDIDKFRKQCTKKKLVKNVKGKAVTMNNGAPVYEEKMDSDMLVDMLISESLVYPDLKNEKLLEYYNCYEYLEMPRKLFTKAKDYNYVAQEIQRISGLDRDRELEIEDEIEDAKN